jgi:hypothetical protein
VKLIEHVSEERIAKMLDYIGQHIDELATLKGAVTQAEYMTKLAEAMAFKSITVGSVEDKKCEARMTAGVQEAQAKEVAAIISYEKMRGWFGFAEKLTELYRTREASTRKGNI